MKEELQQRDDSAASSSAIGRFPVCAKVSAPPHGNLFKLLAAERAQLRTGIDFMTMLLGDATNVIQ
ncbi:hypothetical protein SynBIOSE41_03048 [Synechococcus sp. BIOS-E4-1]|nr:hypothetical protein SynBIOSE41_03048 [Synechococcus sp. BIOS-E4-1]